MIEVHVLIPVADNTGRTFDRQHDQLFESELLNLFGEFSCLPGTVTGQWVDAGQVYTDESRLFVVTLRSITEGAR